MRELLTTRVAAKRIGVKHATCLKYIRTGKLVAVALPSDSKFGVRYRVSPDEVAAFLARHSTLPRRVEAPSIVGPRLPDPATGQADSPNLM